MRERLEESSVRPINAAQQGALIVGHAQSLPRFHRCFGRCRQPRVIIYPCLPRHADVASRARVRNTPLFVNRRLRHSDTGMKNA